MRGGNPGATSAPLPVRWRWRRTLLELGLVSVFVGCHLLVVFLPSNQQETFRWSLLLGLPAVATLLLRRFLPWVSLVVLVTVTIVLTRIEEPVGPLNLAILISVYSVCVRGELPATLGAGALAMIWPISRLPSLPPHAATVMLLGALVNVVMVLGWGRAMRVKRRQAAQLEQAVSLLEQARDQLARDAAAVERARIAREFHDIVSHNLSVVALRAGVARSLVDRDPDHARDTLGELERTSRSSLEQMRQLLSALRVVPDGGQEGEAAPGEDGDRAPVPCLARLDELIESVSGTGVSWRLRRCGRVRELDPGIEMTAYRVVQEAITNVLKHAGRGYARVSLCYQSTRLDIEVSNHTTDVLGRTGSAAPAPESDSGANGHGLIGLRERVSLLGGTLTAHPVPNGFRLSAVLPCPETSDPE
ncbi:Signal transduction histidine kinase [Actinopolyspora xinjiangensis]|uniref:histidine kinase n=1 Tax=Actinopolyspora xinjiangensis TaxID=405564 RepID=A0A1H0TN40_9ACTN|nr:sensor histidine kinase [Actinopolyspora xinjiangensis]SDP55383.1 Signal transduction histidine kinase [Actinopolyspora xinjiangensis]